MSKSDSVKLKNTSDSNYSVGAFGRSFAFAPKEVIEFVGTKAIKYAKGILDNPEIEVIEEDEKTDTADRVVDLNAEEDEQTEEAETENAPAQEETPLGTPDEKAVKVGVAEVTPEKNPENVGVSTPENPAVDKTTSETSISQLNREELEAKATEVGVENPEDFDTKADLVEAIEEKENQTPAVEEPAEEVPAVEETPKEE